MSYLVLARKYRPQNFDEVIGQPVICDLLKSALKSGRLSHAYLFSGPRGIGKTSCARILAKSLNCAEGPALKPCGQCPACVEITEGRSFDVLEIDGASNRGIDEIRALRENVKFSPTAGRFKIYIVDEVHMLTMEAFNALLKTLEEPPPHVKFIFATTAPQKVPSTIISRCQRFDFKRIPIKTIVGALEEIAKKEKFSAAQEALYAVAKAAQGSLRDALSILDQLSALSDRGIQAEDVFSMLGLVETDRIFELADAIGQKNCAAALESLEKIMDSGKDVKQLMRDLTEHFRHLMVIKIGGRGLGRLVDYSIAVKERLLDQGQKFTLREILTAIETLIEAQETARITETLRLPLELAFAKLTCAGGETKAALAQTASVNKPGAAGPQPLRREQKERGPERSFSSASILRNEKGRIDISGSAASPENAAPPIPEPPAEEPENDSEEIAKEEAARQVVDDQAAEVFDPALILTVEKLKHLWDTLTFAVSKEKMSVATFLQDGHPMTFHEGELVIGFSRERKFHKETLESSQNLAVAERIFSEKLKTPVTIKYAIVDEQMPKDEEDLVKNALKTFGGKVVSRWHNE